MNYAYFIPHFAMVCLLIFNYPIFGAVPDQPKITSTTCFKKNALITWKSESANFSTRILKFIMQYNTSYEPDLWISNKEDISYSLRSYSFVMSPWANYTFRVIAVNKFGKSLPSAPTKMCNTSASVPRKNPKNVSGYPAPNCGIIVSWSPVAQIDHNGPGFKYKIVLTPGSSERGWEVYYVDNWNQTELTIENLKAYTVYYFQVRCINDLGPSNVLQNVRRVRSGNCKNNDIEKTSVATLDSTTALYTDTTSETTISHEAIIFLEDNEIPGDVQAVTSQNLMEATLSEILKSTETEDTTTSEIMKSTLQTSTEVKDTKTGEIMKSTLPASTELADIKTSEIMKSTLPTSTEAVDTKTSENESKKRTTRYDSRFWNNTMEGNQVNEMPGGRYFLYGLAGVGALVSLFCAGFVHQYILMKKTRRWLHRITSTEIEEFLQGTKEISLINSQENTDPLFNPLSVPYDKTYEIAKEDLCILDTVIGYGAYAKVYKAVLKKLGKKETVAVKTVDPSDDTIYFKALISELKILSYIGKHPNVISLIGCVTTNIKYRNLYLVLEFCEKGDLESHLRHNRKYFCDQATKKPYENITDERIITQYTLYKWALEIARGMHFLASKKIVHGDLATRNVLLTNCCTAKISDFGLSKHLYKDSLYMKLEKVPVPWKWMSMEGLQFNIFSSESDMWSYGVTLWEIFSLGQVPYTGEFYNFEFIPKLLEGQRLPRPTYACEKIYETMLLMWQIEPESRPTFKTVIPILESILAEENTINYTVLHVL